LGHPQLWQSSHQTKLNGFLLIFFSSFFLCGSVGFQARFRHTFPHDAESPGAFVCVFSVRLPRSASLLFESPTWRLKFGSLFGGSFGKRSVATVPVFRCFSHFRYFG
jgi:hypothetical protein